MDFIQQLLMMKKKTKKIVKPKMTEVENKLMEELENCPLEETSKLMKSYFENKDLSVDPFLIPNMEVLTYGKISRESLMGLKMESQICGASFGDTDLMWKCQNCTKMGDATCFCTECFLKSPHEGHNTLFKLFGKGCCDCGDPSASDESRFCPLHSAVLDIESIKEKLPYYILRKSPLIITEIARFVHLKMAEKTNGKLFDSFVQMLADFSCNSACQALVAEILQQEFSGHNTNHQCRRTDTTEIHECSCNLTDMLIRYFYISEGLEDVYEHWLSELSRSNIAFSLKLAQSYWKNYFYLLDFLSEQNEERKISNALFQASAHFKQMIPFFDGYMDEMAENIKLISEIMLVEPFEEVSSNLTLHFFNDFFSLFNYEKILTEKIFEHGKIIEGLFELMVNLSKLCIASFPLEEKGYQSKSFTDYYWHLFWGQFICCIEFDKLILPLQKRYFSYIKKSIQQAEIGIPDLKNLYTTSVEIYRIFSISIQHLLYSKFTNPSKCDFSSNDLLDFRKEVRSLLELPDEEMDSILIRGIERIFRAIIFTYQNDCFYWGMHSPLEIISRVYNHLILSQDYGYIQLLLATLLSNPLQSPVRIFQILCQAAGFDVFRAELEENETVKNRRLLASCILGAICKMILDNQTLPLNQCSLFSLYSSEKKSISSNRRKLFESLIRKCGVTNVLSCDETKLSIEKINMIKLVESLDNHLQLNETEEILEAIIDNTQESKGKVTLKKELLQEVNLFNSRNIFAFDNIEKNLQTICKIHNIKECDAFAGLCDFSDNINTFLFNKLICNKEMIAFIMELLEAPREYLAADGIKTCCFALLYKVLKGKPDSEILSAMNSGLIEKEGKKHMEKSPIYSMAIQSILHDIKKEDTPVIDVNISEDTSALAHSKEEAEKRRKEILDKFKKSQMAFAKTNEEELNKVAKVTLTEKDIICSVCLEPVSPETFDENPYGRQVEKASNNSIHFALKQRARSLGIANKKVFKQDYLQSFLKYDIISCGHYMHQKCYEKLLIDLKKKSLQCPLCKAYFSNLLPVVPAVDPKYSSYFSLNTKKDVPPSLDDALKLFTLASELEMVGFSKALISRSSVLQDYIKLVLCEFLKNPEIYKGELKEFLAKCYTEFTESPILIFISLALLSALESYKNFQNLGISLEKEVDNLLSYVCLQHASYVSLTKGGDFKDLNILLKSELPGRKESIFYFVKQMAIVMSVFMDWDSKMKDSLDSNVKSENIKSLLLTLFGIKMEDPYLQIAENAVRLTETSTQLPTLISGLTPELKEDFLFNLSIVSNPLTFSFISLPETYDEVILNYNNKPCVHCKKHSKNCIICLLCGQIICKGVECSFKTEKGKNIIAQEHHIKKCGLDCCLFLDLYAGCCRFSSDRSNAYTAYHTKLQSPKIQALQSEN